MNKELKFDHFKNIEELLEHIDIWYKEDDIDYTRWFHLEDLKKVKDYITNLQQENKQLKSILIELEEWLKSYLYMLNGITDKDIYEKQQLDDFTDFMDKIQELKEKILGDKENE